MEGCRKNRMSTVGTKNSGIRSHLYSPNLQVNSSIDYIIAEDTEVVHIHIYDKTSHVKLKEFKFKLSELEGSIV